MEKSLQVRKNKNYLGGLAIAPQFKREKKMCSCLQREKKSDSDLMKEVCVCKNHKAYCCYGYYMSSPHAKNGKDYKKHVKIA